MTTTITATFNRGGEKTVRTLTLPHDVTERVGELLGIGLLAELTDDWGSDACEINVHREVGTASRDEPHTHPYRIGDTIEVIASVGCGCPPIGTRTQIAAIDENDTLYPIGVDWEDNRRWFRLNEVKHVAIHEHIDIVNDHERPVTIDTTAYDQHIAAGNDVRTAPGFTASVRVGEATSNDRSAHAHDFRVGDLVEVVQWMNTGGKARPPIGHRGQILTIEPEPDSFGQCIEIEGTITTGWWCRLDEIKRVT